MTQRLDYSTVAADGMKALGGVYGYVAHSGCSSTSSTCVCRKSMAAPTVSTCIRDLLKDGLTVQKLVLVPAWHEAGDLFWNRSARRSVGRKP